MVDALAKLETKVASLEKDLAVVLGKEKKNRCMEDEEFLLVCK
jgi:hypothetical protein